MKNEIVEFFQRNAGDVSYLVEDCRSILNTNKSNDQRSYVLLNILSEMKENITSSDELKGILDEETVNNLSLFLKEEGGLLKEYFSWFKQSKNENTPKLVDFDWKFIGLASIDKLDTGEITPKILIRLIFNNGKTQLIESDFANLKKLQEEIEENLSSFNSTYSRRIETFSK